MIKIGNSEVDFEGHIIDGPAGYQSMEPKVMTLLRVLTDNAGKVMTREDLINAVWGVEFGGDERLSRAISLLRKALGDKRGQHTHIATISRVGYRFIAEVSYADEMNIQNSSQKSNQPSQPSSSNAPAYTALSNSESAKTLEPSVETSAPNASALPFKSMAAVAALLLTCLTIGLFAFSNKDSASITTPSLQANMEQGFSHVKDFAVAGAVKDAQDIFSGILAEDPDHAAARAGLALAVFREYTHLEKDPALLRRGKAHAQAALRADEHLALANIAAAWSAEFEGEFERAHEYLDRADVLDENNIFAIESRFRTFGKQGDTAKAREILETAIATHPDQSLFYSHRANVYARDENFSAAEADFRRAIELSPDNPRSYAALAHVLYSQNKTNEALATIQKGLKVNETPLLYNNLGTYLFFQGEYDLAASAFEKTLELSGDTHDHLYWANLADAYRWSEDKKNEAPTSYRRAIQLLETDLKKNQKSNTLRSRAALFNAKLGNLDEAQRYMESFELTSNSSAILHYRALVTYEIMSDRDMALKSLEAALAANYPLIEILNDPELSRLRQDPDYHRLLAKTKNN